MSILEDIKQTKPFRSPLEKVTVNILFTSNWLTTEQACFLKKYGLSGQQYNVLRILRGQHPNPITVNEIIERMLDKMSNASRLVDKLLLKGLVERNQRATDRRACDVSITEKGLKILNEIDGLQKNWEGGFSKLTETEAETLSNLLDKLREK
ncbi:MAG: MarR family winged helix-turn-helix transcriptional regulator [Spirosomataceae bacterium]